MKFADSVKQAASLTSTATITLGAAATGFRTLAQAITDTAGKPEQVAVGDIICMRVEDAADASKWEISTYTITAPGTLTRLTIVSSSAAGAALTFSGSVSVLCTVPSITLSEGMTNPNDIGFDIVLCAGQSNMVGLGTVVANIDIADPRVFQFGAYPSETATYQKIVTGVDPLKHPYESAPGLSPASWFSKTYAGMIPSNRRVLLVPVAQGGQALVYVGGAEVKWAPGNPGGTLYELAISNANAAIAAALQLYPNSRFVGTLWLQGEADGGFTVSTANYAAALKTLIAGFRSRITGAANSWFIMGGMVPEAIAANAGYPAIQAAHIQVANETAKCAFVAGTAGNQNGDNLHYNAQGARIMGCGMASAVPAAKLSAGVIIPATAVTLARNASSGYVGSPVTVTVSTNQPLTGSQTESVQLTSNVAGTFSVNPVLLSAGVLTAASAFTPSAAGSATITGAATGTPSLTAGTIGYTANAITAPAQMAAPVATAGINSATVALTAPSSNGGAAVTGYTVVSNPAGGVDSNAGTTGLNHTMTGLVAGTAYTFTATATNQVGPSPASPASNSVTPTASATAPGAPTIGTAVAGDGYVDVAFTAPSSNGGAAIIDYTATLSTGQTATGTASPIRVTAPDGTAVTATVKARNSVNSGPASAASNSVTPVAAMPKARMNAVTIVGLTEGGTAPDYTYTGTNTGYSGTPMGGTSNLTMAGDGMVMCQILTLGGSKPMLGLHTGSALVAYASIPYNLFADTAGYRWLGGGSFVKTDVNTTIIPASGDWMRWRRVGTTYYAEVSKDSQQSWQTVFSIAGAAGTIYAQIQTDGTAVLSTVSGTGIA